MGQAKPYLLNCVKQKKSEFTIKRDNRDAMDCGTPITYMSDIVNNDVGVRNKIEPNFEQKIACLNRINPKIQGWADS